MQQDIATSSVGTLFLDQVSELTQQQQQRLSNPLADCDEFKTGDQGHIRGKRRIISASSRDLRQEVRLSRFRRELFHRLAEVTSDVPPLTARGASLGS